MPSWYRQTGKLHLVPPIEIVQRRHTETIRDNDGDIIRYVVNDLVETVWDRPMRSVDVIDRTPKRYDPNPIRFHQLRLNLYDVLKPSGKSIGRIRRTPGQTKDDDVWSIVYRINRQGMPSVVTESPSFPTREDAALFLLTWTSPKRSKTKTEQTTTKAVAHAERPTLSIRG